MRDLASTDRRRVPRAVIADTELSVLAFPIPVRLLDISLGGVLLEFTQVDRRAHRGGGKRAKRCDAGRRAGRTGST